MECKCSRIARSLCSIPKFRPQVRLGKRYITPAGQCLEAKHNHTSRHSIRSHSTQKPRSQLHPSQKQHTPSSEISSVKLGPQDEQQLKHLANRVLRYPGIPSEQQTLETLEAINRIARALHGLQEQQDTFQDKNNDKEDRTPASALLSLDSKQTKDLKVRRPSSESSDFISKIVYEIVKHPSVFIGPKILSSYVSTQSLLGRPSSFPEIFDLYASKPVPRPVSKADNKNITYKPQNYKAISAAVPADVANAALGAAIEAKDLVTAVSIVNTTFRAPAYQRAKLFQRALPFGIGGAFAPLAVYTLASEFAKMQNMMDYEDMTAYAFLGGMTYVVGVGTLGYTALTTHNDQMKRVSWAIGTPLYERWLREDERAACDKIAMAWGFKEKWRWGEEEGEEWQELKDWMGYRSMNLDSTTLMPDMK